MPEITPPELFRRWFKAPIEKLKECPDGDGGFIALAVALFLFERYYRALAKATPPRTTQESTWQQFAADFGVTEKTAEGFWDMARNGLLHQGMFKQKQHGRALAPYEMSGSFPALRLRDGNPPVYELDPWKIADKVLQLWEAHLDLFDSNTSFPVASIRRVAQAAVTYSPGPVAIGLSDTNENRTA